MLDIAKGQTALFPGAIGADNPILDTDSYKYSHWNQYPEGTGRVSSYIEARRASGAIDHVLFFGLQVELAALGGVFVTQGMLDEAAGFLKAHGFELFARGWQHIIDAHGGRLPIEIAALPEGTLAPVSVPQVRIENTDPACWWLPSFLETRLLRAVWYPATVASISHHVVGEIRRRLVITDGSAAGAEFKLHDFGARGAACQQAAGLGGAAHLVNSLGTDTVPALAVARNFYGADMAGFSIPASEHSTMTALGEEGELAQMERLLRAYPRGLVACVSDSYDLFRAIEAYWGGALKGIVEARDGVLVVRPDSGDPVKIVPAVIEALMERLGFETTRQGYRRLPPFVRVIQGDGIDRTSITGIMDAMMDRGLSIGNVAFGMGGGLLQKVDRDTFGYAMKASALKRNGVWHDIHKDPKTAGGTKRSKRGRQGAVWSDGTLRAARLEDIPAGEDALRPVFRDGEILLRQTLDEIRARAWPGVPGLDPRA